MEPSGIEVRLSGQVLDEVDLVVSVVPGSDAGNVTVAGPRRVGAGERFDLIFGWDVSSLQPGEAWFGLVELGSDKRATSDVGSFLFTLRNPDGCVSTVVGVSLAVRCRPHPPGRCGSGPASRRRAPIRRNRASPWDPSAHPG